MCRLLIQTARVVIGQACSHINTSFDKATSISFSAFSIVNNDKNYDIFEAFLFHMSFTYANKFFR